MPGAHPRALMVLALVLVCSTARAGDWHSASNLVCSDCHTMHNSSGGAPMRYDLSSAPAAHLLRHETTESLCLYCHDGSNTGAPDVIAPVTYVGDPAGGFFATTGGTTSGTGHDLNTTAVPPGGSQSMTLTCVSCHDPHGTSNHRNLRGDPSGTGQLPVAVVVDETTRANGTNPAEVYLSSNLKYRTGMSAWCRTCHPDLHQSSGGFIHSDATIYGSVYADWATWAGPIVNRVPVANPTDPRVPSQDDQVFCLSCHKAHGSQNPFGQIYADGVTQSSTCQQCHNQ